MARQVEGSLPALEHTDELPALTAEAVRRLELGDPAFRPDTADALDRSLEALRETLERAEARWQLLESRIAEQDRAIRELKDELRRADADRFDRTTARPAGVPELTEIVRSTAVTPAAAGRPATGNDMAADASPAVLLESGGDLRP